MIPDDMQALALPVLAHRLLPSAEAVVTAAAPGAVLAAIVDRVSLPQLRGQAHPYKDISTRSQQTRY